jgi:hypothetical protein
LLIKNNGIIFATLNKKGVLPLRQGVTVENNKRQEHIYLNFGYEDGVLL